MRLILKPAPLAMHTRTYEMTSITNDDVVGLDSIGDLYLQNRRHNNLHSRLAQLPRNVQAKIASLVAPHMYSVATPWKNKCLFQLANTCSALLTPASSATVLEVAAELFLHPEACQKFLARFKDLLSLTIQVDHRMTTIDLLPLVGEAVMSRLQHLELQFDRPDERVVLNSLACDVMAGLQALKTLKIEGFDISESLHLSPSVTGVVLRYCNLRAAAAGVIATGSGVSSFEIYKCYQELPEIDLRGVPAIREFTNSDCLDFRLTVELFPFPSVLETLTGVTVRGEILTQLTSLRKLQCRTQSEFVDLRDCTHLETLDLDSARMTILDLSSCSQLVALIVQATSLAQLQVQGCTQLLKCSLRGCSLVRQPFQPGTPWKVESLDLGSSSRLADVSGLPSSLRNLSLNLCTNLICFPRVHLPHMYSLDVSHCPRLVAMDISECPLLSALNRKVSSLLTDDLIMGLSACTEISTARGRTGQLCGRMALPGTSFCTGHSPEYS